jgi:hypothetical protein
MSDRGASPDAGDVVVAKWRDVVGVVDHVLDDGCGPV